MKKEAAIKRMFADVADTTEKRHEFFLEVCNLYRICRMTLVVRMTDPAEPPLICQSVKGWRAGGIFSEQSIRQQ
jgi:hypothetical protein